MKTIALKSKDKERPSLQAICIMGYFSDEHWRVIRITPEQYHLVESIIATNGIQVVDKVVNNLQELKVKL